MFIPMRKLLFGKDRQRGFTLIELLIVVLIVGILAAIGIPLYIGYINDAKSAEGKAVAGALWTGVQSNALGSCNTAVAVSTAYNKSGMPGGFSPGSRWTVSAGGTNTLTVTCATGAYSASAADLFTIRGSATDISSIQVRLNYVPAGTPPSRMQCNLDGGTTFNDC